MEMENVFRLSESEIFHAAMIGVKRRLDARKKNRPQQSYGPPPAGRTWNIEIESCCAEMCAAKYYNQYWNALADDLASLPGDIGAVQVRHTEYPEGCLLLHREDPDHAPFVLVIGKNPIFRIVGWTWARNGKLEKWWRADKERPAFFVPQSALHPPDELRTILFEQGERK